MKQIILCIAVLFLSFSFTQGQVNAIPFSQSMDTYQPISGTVVDLPSEDDVFHANLPVGFTFIYNGAPVSKFGVCTNGFMVLDSLSHSPMWTLNGNSVKQISVLEADMQNLNAGGSIEYTTLGTAPNRVLVVQWKDYCVYANPFCHLNAQIRIHENTGCIQLCYGYNVLAGNTGKIFAVGLVGNTNADYNLRQTTNNWVNSSPSVSFPGNLMFLSPLSVCPNGLVFSFGTCPPTGIPFSYMTGNVYNDANNNGIKDIGENGLANIIVHENLQNYYTVTDTSGNYALFYSDSNLTYTVHAQPLMYWNISSTPTTYTVTPMTQPTNNLDFGIYATPNIHDVSIISTCTSPWPNGNVIMNATYHNNGTVLESGDSVFFVKDSHYTLVTSTPAPALINGDSIIWVYSNLLLNEYRNIHVQLHADTTIAVGDTLHSFWTVKPVAGDAAPLNNVFALHQPCMAAFDPNMKTVTPDGNILNSQELLYTIYFQNTGNAAALNVFLFDTLDQNLDVSTFKLAAFSHPVTYTISGTGNLAFTFANISLPDSLANEPASHGMVSYTIKPKAGLTLGTLLYNTASIVFDFNSAIVTNTTQNIIIEMPNGIGNTSAVDQSIVIYPNPAGNEIHIAAGKPFENALVSITDLNGKTLVQKSYTNTTVMSINLAQLPKGIYVLEVQDGAKISRRKLIKQ